MYSYVHPHMAGQKQDDQHEHTYSSYVRIRDVALKTCQRRWTIGKSGERRSGISVLVVRQDDEMMYRKISMGSVLGPTMAGIFVGFHGVYLLSKCTVPDVYFCNIDDTFCIFGSETEACKFFPILIKCTLLFDLLSRRRVIPHYHFLMFQRTNRLLVS